MPDIQALANDPALFRSTLLVDGPDGAPTPFRPDHWQDRDARSTDQAMLRLAGKFTGDCISRSYRERGRGGSKTTDVSMDVLHPMVFSPRPLSAVWCAADWDQAALGRATISRLCRMNPLLESALEIQSSTVRNTRTGSELRFLTSDAGSSYGLLVDIAIMDETVHWRPNSDEFATSIMSAVAKRETAVLLVGTNCGWHSQKWQWALREHARESPLWHFHALHERPSWISDATLEEQRSLLPPTSFRRLFENIWISGVDSPLLPRELMLPCQSDETLWPGGEMPDGFRGELYIGVDIGAVRDRSVVWTFELLAGVLWTREVAVLPRGMPLAEQKHEIARRLNRRVVALKVDVGAQGFQIARELEAEHPHIVEAVGLSQGRQGQLGAAMRDYFARQRIRIPNDPEIVADFELVEEVQTGSGGTPILRTNRRADIGHGDRFWSAALAVYGVPFHVPSRSRFKGLPVGYRFSHINHELRQRYPHHFPKPRFPTV